MSNWQRRGTPGKHEVSKWERRGTGGEQVGMEGHRR